MARIVLFIISLLAVVPAQAATFAFLGDSLSTGAVTHPALRFGHVQLRKIFTGGLRLDPPPATIGLLKDSSWHPAADFLAPVRLPVSDREFQSGVQWVRRHLLNGFSALYLDTEEFSWANLLARRLGARPDEVLIAAEDGARMLMAVRQADRVLDHNQGLLPDYVFIFFTGNDLCGPGVSFVTPVDEYATRLEEVIDYLFRNGRPARAGTRIVVLDPVGVMQLAVVPDILDKKVEAHGRTMTCRELQAMPAAVPENPDAVEDVTDLFLNMFPRSPVAWCPTVLLQGLSADESAEIRTILANRIIGYRKAIGDVINSYNKEEGMLPDGFSLQHVRGTGNLSFLGEDIAQDCFHLSLKGQMKVAGSVFQELQKGP